MENFDNNQKLESTLESTLYSLFLLVIFGSWFYVIFDYILTLRLRVANSTSELERSLVVNWQDKFEWPLIISGIICLIGIIYIIRFKLMRFFFVRNSIETIDLNKNMKTLKGWEKSNLDLKDYLSEPCQIDESLYNYFGEVVVPQYCYDGLVQLGEAKRTDDKGVMFYMTSVHVNGKYFYLGILPEFC